MKKNVKITILKSEVDHELARQYAIPHFEACPFHKPDRFLSVTVKTNRKSCVNMRGCPSKIW